MDKLLLASGGSFIDLGRLRIFDGKPKSWPDPNSTDLGLWADRSGIPIGWTRIRSPEVGSIVIAAHNIYVGDGSNNRVVRFAH